MRKTNIDENGMNEIDQLANLCVLGRRTGYRCRHHALEHGEWACGHSREDGAGV